MLRDMLRPRHELVEILGSCIGQLLVSIREINEDMSGVETIIERIGSLPGEDHFGHAMNYLAIALRKQSTKPKSDFIF